nr:hypothetical protein [Rhodococcus sp. 14C212]
MNVDQGVAVHAERFADFITATGPFASVYYEDSHATEDAAKVAELTRRSISERLEQLGAPQAVLENVERAVTGAPTAIGSGGRAVVANPEGVLVHERLVRPPVRTEVRVSETPYLLPLVEHGTSGRSYLVAAVDHAGGDLTVYDRHGAVRHEETVTGEGYPIHKAAGRPVAGLRGSRAERRGAAASQHRRRCRPHHRTGRRAPRRAGVRDR